MPDDDYILDDARKQKLRDAVIKMTNDGISDDEIGATVSAYKQQYGQKKSPSNTSSASSDTQSQSPSNDALDVMGATLPKTEQQPTTPTGAIGTSPTNSPLANAPQLAGVNNQGDVSAIAPKPKTAREAAKSISDFSIKANTYKDLQQLQQEKMQDPDIANFLNVAAAADKGEAGAEQEVARLAQNPKIHQGIQYIQEMQGKLGAMGIDLQNHQDEIQKAQEDLQGGKLDDEKPKSLSEGLKKSYYGGFANFYKGAVTLENAIGKAIHGKDYEPVTVDNSNALKLQYANEAAAKELQDAPNTTAGSIVKGIGGLPSMFAGLLAVPETKVPQFVAYMGAGGAIKGLQDQQDKEDASGVKTSLLQDLPAAAKEGLKGTVDGALMELSMGGSKYFNGIYKPIVSGAGVGGYEAVKSKILNGEVNLQDVISNAVLAGGMGFAHLDGVHADEPLNAENVAKAKNAINMLKEVQVDPNTSDAIMSAIGHNVQTIGDIDKLSDHDKALIINDPNVDKYTREKVMTVEAGKNLGQSPEQTFFSVPDATLKQVMDNPLTAEQARKQAEDLRSKTTEDPHEAEQNNLAATALDKMADIKEVSAKIADNPDLYLQHLDEAQDITPEERDSYKQRIEQLRPTEAPQEAIDPIEQEGNPISEPVKTEADEQQQTSSEQNPVSEARPAEITDAHRNVINNDYIDTLSDTEVAKLLADKKLQDELAEKLHNDFYKQPPTVEKNNNGENGDIGKKTPEPVSGSKSTETTVDEEPKPPAGGGQDKPNNEGVKAGRFSKYKIDTKNTAYDAMLGIPIAVWNGAMDAMDLAHEATGKIKDAVQAGIDHIKSKLSKEELDKFDEDEFRRHFEDEEDKAISARNAVTEADLMERGIEPEKATTKQKDRIAKAREAAKETLRKNPNAAAEIIDEYNKEPFPLSTEQQEIVLYKKEQLKSERTELDRLSVKEGEDGENQLYIQSQLARNRGELIEVANTLRGAGTEMSDAFAARRAINEEDYHVSSMEAAFSADNGGRDLTKEELKEVKDSSEKINETIKNFEEELAKERKKNEELEAKNKELQSQKKGKDWEQKQRSKKRSEDVVVLRERRKGAIDAIDAILKDQRSNISSNPLRADLLPHIKTIAETYVGEGVLKIEDVVDKVHSELKDKIPNLSLRQVRDAITGHGYEPKKQTKTELQNNLAKVKREGELLSQIEDLQAGKTKPYEAPKEKDARLKELEKQRNELLKEQGLNDEAKKERDAQKKLNDLQKQLDDIQSDQKPDATKEKKEQDARVTELQKQVKEAKKEFGITQAQTNRAIQTRYKNLEQQYRNMLAKGEYEKPAVPKTPLSPEAIQAQKNMFAAKGEWEKKRDYARQKNLSNLQKGAKTLINFMRASKLGVVVELKLIAAAAHLQMAAIPAEYLAGKALSKIPVFGRVFKNAGSESDIPITQFAKAYSTGWVKGIVAAAKNFAYKDSELDKMSGKSKDVPPEFKDWFTAVNRVIGYNIQTHKAIKATPRQTQFEVSQSVLMSEVLKNGVDITDQKEMFKITNQAIMEADRRVLQNKNVVTGLWKNILNGLENNKIAPRIGKAAGLVARIEVPFSTAPVNFGGQALRYTFGLPAGAAKHIYAAVTKGVENLTPEERAVIARTYKMGSVGGALALLGYANYKNVGSILPDKKKPDDDPERMNIRIWDTDIPHVLVHSPHLMAYFYGATVHHMQDKLMEDSDEMTKAKAATLGGGAALAGIISEDPYLHQMEQSSETIDAMKKPSGKIGYIVGTHLRGHLIPKIVQEGSEAMDRGAGGKAVKRQADGVLENMQLGTPWRKNLPEKEE